MASSLTYKIKMKYIIHFKAECIIPKTDIHIDFHMNEIK